MTTETKFILFMSVAGCVGLVYGLYAIFNKDKFTISSYLIAIDGFMMGIGFSLVAILLYFFGFYGMIGNVLALKVEFFIGGITVFGTGVFGLVNKKEIDQKFHYLWAIQNTIVGGALAFGMLIVLILNAMHMGH